MTRVSHIRAFAYYAFFPIILTFLSYVGLGYYIMVSSQWPNWPSILVILLCLIVVAAIYFFVRHTGFAIADAIDAPGSRRLAWFPLFLLLFVFSGYGFLTSSMLLIEGPDIAREEIAALTTNIGKLQAAASDLTKSEPFDTFYGQIEANRKALMHEINNTRPGYYCGIGPYATTIITNIRNLGKTYDLPFPSPSELPQKPILCSDTEEIKRYMVRYNELIDTIEQGRKQQLGLVDKEQLRDTILTQIKPDDAALKEAQDRLAGVNYFFNLGLYHDVLGVVSHAAFDYRQAAAKLSGFKIAEIDSGEFEHLGLFLYIPKLVWDRMLYSPTILLFLLAILCDVLASCVVAVVLRQQRQLLNEQETAAAATRVGGKEVTYLWRPEPHPLAAPGTRR
jgi:hypothetical protein